MKAKTLIISVIITLVFASIIFLVFVPSGSPLGSYFDVYIVLIVTHYLAVGFGAVMLLLRILKILKNNGLLIYLLAGTLNIFLAIVGITLFICGQADQEWLHKSLANLFVGFLIMADTLLFNKTN